MINFKNDENKIRYPYNNQICAIKVDFQAIKLMDIGTITDNKGDYNLAACSSDELPDSINKILDGCDIFNKPITMLFRVVDDKNHIYEELMSGVNFFIDDKSKFLYEPSVLYNSSSAFEFVTKVRTCGLFYCALPEEIYKITDEVKYKYFNESIVYQDKIKDTLNIFVEISRKNIDSCYEKLLDQIRAVEYVDGVISKIINDKVKSKSKN